MVTMGKYEAKGTGLNHAVTRKRTYTLLLVFFSVVVDTAITFGFITKNQVYKFIAVPGWSVAALAGRAGLLQAVLAKKNVDPLK